MSADSDQYAERGLSVFRSAQQDIDTELQAAANNWSYLAESGRASRSRAVEKRIERTVDSTKGFDPAWVVGDAYLAGAKSFNPEYDLKTGDRKIIRSQSEKLGKNLETAQKGAKANARTRVAEVRKAGNPREARESVQRKPVSAVTYKNGTKHSLGTYSDMAIRAQASIAYNRGVLEAAHKAGVEAFEVVDSSDCGLESHDSPNKAAGLIMGREDCLAHPISHPYCGRTFIPRPDLEKPKDRWKKRLTTAAKKQLQVQAAAAAVNAVLVGSALAKQTEVGQKFSLALLNREESWLRFKMRLEEIAREQGNVYDITTGKVVKTKINYIDVLDDIVLNYEHRVFDQAAALPGGMVRVLNTGATEISERTQALFEDLQKAYLRLSDPRKPLGDIFQSAKLADELVSVWWDWSEKVRDIRTNYIKFSVPDLGRSAGRRFRLNMTPDSAWVRVTNTVSVTKGYVANIRLNPQGLVRAGAYFDSTTRRFRPNLSIIPKGPIRISTRLNRAGGFLVTEDNLQQAIAYAEKNGLFEIALRNGIKDPLSIIQVGERIGEGLVTSASIKMRVISKWTNGRFFLGDPSLNFNMNLRRLGLMNLREIRNLSVSDFRRMFADDGGPNRAFLKFLNITTDLRIRGWGPLRIRRTLRIASAETLEKIMALSDIEMHSRILRSKAATFAQAAQEVMLGQVKFDLNFVRDQLINDWKHAIGGDHIGKSLEYLDGVAVKILNAANANKAVVETLKVLVELQSEIITFFRKFNPMSMVMNEAHSLVGALLRSRYVVRRVVADEGLVSLFRNVRSLDTDYEWVRDFVVDSDGHRTDFMLLKDKKTGEVVVKMIGGSSLNKNVESALRGPVFKKVYENVDLLSSPLMSVIEDSVLRFKRIFPQLPNDLILKIDNSTIIDNAFAWTHHDANIIQFDPATVFDWELIKYQSRRMSVSGYFSPSHLDDPFRAVVVHELGHIMTMNLIETDKSFFDNVMYNIGVAFAKQHKPGSKEGLTAWIRKDLGGYALSDNYELFAEALTEYVMSPNPGVIAKIVGDAMKDYLRSSS